MEYTFTFTVDVDEEKILDHNFRLNDTLGIPIDRAEELCNLAEKELYEDSKKNLEYYNSGLSVLNHLKNNDWTGPEIMFLIISGFKSCIDAKEYHKFMSKNPLGSLMNLLMSSDGEKEGKGHLDDILKEIQEHDSDDDDEE